jgi:hypothetical protein
VEPQLAQWQDNVADDRVQLERFRAAQDSDGATQQTIGIMCRYIRESADDDQVKAAANWALDSFGGSSADPAMKAWAVFWFLKHYMRFVVDEAPMFRLNEPNQQDLLYKPSVMIRMQDPAGDCDDFTMMGAALLKALGVPFVIVTIAAGPDDPQRWSHVFLMAMLPSGPLPIDASHGSGPGWMVPASHTYRWQCWDEDGKAVDVQRPRKHGLNGWVQTGLGQDPTTMPVVDTTPIDTSGLFSGSGTAPFTAPTTSSTAYNSFLLGGGSTPSSGPSFDLTSFLNNLTNAAAGTTKSYVNAQTQQEMLAMGLGPNGMPLNMASMFGNILPFLMIGLGAYLLVTLVKNK